MGTSVERHSAVTDLSRKAEGFGVSGVRVDGMDVLAVRETVAEHIRLAREERTPTLVEAFTYRFRGHSAADPEVYREKEEVEEWQRKDPVETFAARLADEKVISEAEVEKIREQAEAEVLAAVEFADASPEPPLESLYDHLYVVGEQVPGWYAVDERSPDPHPGEEERQAGKRAQELAERGAAYAAPGPAPKRVGGEPNEGEALDQEEGG
jgi:pyruvate dehydrogenase E1 component alpha subunit